jgi:GntR family transcriptional regulator/MocR family aminotransferase
MALRAAIAEHVASTRNVHVSAEQVIIVAGAQLGLNLTMRVLAREGDPIVMENPCNQGAAYLFESLGLCPLPLDVDLNGMQTAQLFERDARLCYVMPSHHYPLGPTLSLKRRKNIVKWAAATGAYIIEDDYDSEFAYDGVSLPSLTSLSPENSIYLGTFSKSLGAGLRTGYAIFPTHLVPAAIAAKALLDNGQAWLEQASLAEFIHSGGFMRHLRRSRIRYMLRRNALVSAMNAHFPDCVLCGTGGGTHLAWRVPEELGTSHLVMSAAQSRNIGVYTIQSAGGHEYDSTQFDDRWLLLGYASLTEEQISAGIARLAEIVANLPKKMQS